MPVTIKDIAQKAGVSYVTVSRVINGIDYPVRAETREKVLAAAQELGYTPNLLARYLQKQRSDDIGILVPNLSNPLLMDALRRIELFLTDRRYNVLFSTSGRDREKEESILRNFLSKQVCGVILMDIEGHEQQLSKMAEQGIVIAAVDGGGEYSFPILRMSCDLEACGRAAAEHLLAMGRNRVAYISGPLTKTSRRLVLKGAGDCLAEHGFPLNPALVCSPKREQDLPEGNYEYQNGIQLTEWLLQHNTPFDAVLAGNDMTALGALEALRRAGKRVPQDVAVMGCDNTMISAMTSPSLSTVETYFSDMAVLCAQLLTDRLEKPAGGAEENKAAVLSPKEGKNSGENHLVIPKPQVIARASTRV